MARVVKNTDAQVINAEVVTTLTNGQEIKKTLNVGDVVEGLRYIENETLKSVSGRIVKINAVVNEVTRVDLKDAKDYFAKDVIVKTIVIDASEQYQSNVVTVDAREIVEDEGVVDVKRVDVFAHGKVTMDIQYTDGTTSSQDIEVGDVFKDVVIMTSPGKPDITGTFRVKAFAYSAISKNDNRCKITGVYLASVDGGDAFLVSFSNFIRLEETTHTDVSDTKSLASIADALNEATATGDGVVYATLGVDVEIPKREDGKITTLMIGEGQTLNMDLGGHNLDCEAYAFYVNGGVLNITDTSGDGTGAIKCHHNNKAYPAVQVLAGGVCNMTGGHIDTRDVDDSGDNVNWLYGVVCSGDGVFNMTGGSMTIGGAAGISITNGTATGEGAQFIIGGDSKITSVGNAAVYLADNKRVVIKDNAVIDGGIVVRLGDISVEGSATVNGFAGEPTNLGVQACVSGVDAASAAILALTGCYNSALGNDCNISIAKTAKVIGKHDHGIDIAMVDTNYDQIVNVDIEDEAAVRAPEATWFIYDHDRLAELATEGGKTLPAKNATTTLTVKIGGVIVYPVVDEEAAG